VPRGECTLRSRKELTLVNLSGAYTRVAPPAYNCERSEAIAATFITIGPFALVDFFRAVSGGTLQVIGLAEPGIRSGEKHFGSYDRGSLLSAVLSLAEEALLVNHVLLRLLLLLRGHLMPDSSRTPHPGIGI